MPQAATAPLRTSKLAVETFMNTQKAMRKAKLAIDPLWQCLCPSWTLRTARHTSRLLAPPTQPALRCFQSLARTRTKSEEYAMYAPVDREQVRIFNPLQDPARAISPDEKAARKPRPAEKGPRRTVAKEIDYTQESVQSLYGHLSSAAIDGKAQVCRYVAEMLVRDREQKPSLQIYNALILSNISHNEGAAWRVIKLLDDMQEDGLQPDSGTCHAVLKVLSVHVDHLLRSDVLEYMSQRWFQLSEDGAHDVAAGLLREGLFEQGLERIEIMRQDGMHIHAWILDMAVYILCEANEISEAHRIMRDRVASGELHLSRSLWSFFLDKAAEARHHAATSLAWSSQVMQKYINPSSGICLNVLATAAQAADAVMATAVFTHLSKRGTTFLPIHYELLLLAYLNADPPDLKRAASILTIMPLEKLEPSSIETRALYFYLRDKQSLLPEVLDTLRDLHGQGRKIPIAALNLLIECYVEQKNLSEAVKVYKLIHTFAPMTEGASKTFANIDTFNLLLRGCRLADPPDAHQASFLINELLALRIIPTTLTYDRLITVFVSAGLRALTDAANLLDAETQAREKVKGVELIDWTYRHFTEMQNLGWMPRFGTVETLGVELAKLGDARCWDVLQAADDSPEKVSGWREKGHFVKRNIEAAWGKAQAETEEPAVDTVGEIGM